MDQAQCSVTYVYSIALWTVSIYDWLVCLAEEWRALWKRKQFGAIEVGYLMTRYYTTIAIGICLSVFARTKNPGECGHWNLIVPLVSDISTWACDFVIAMRCYALWSRDIRIGVFLTVLWATEIGLMSVALPYYHNLPDVLGAPAACIPVGRTSKPSLTLLTWISPAAFCLVLLILTTLRAWQLYRRAGTNSLLTMCIRDGALYAFVVFSIYTVNAVFFAQGNVSIQATNANAAFILPGIIASRMILRLRLAGEAVSAGVGGPPSRGKTPGLSGAVRSHNNTVLVEISRTRHEDIDVQPETKESTPSRRTSRPIQEASESSLHDASGAV